MRFIALFSLVWSMPLAGQGLAFAAARYASQSAHTLYVGYRAGPLLAIGGVLQNPRTAYREAMIGLARPIGTGRSTLTVAAALATTSDGDYAQLYLLPTAGLGPVLLDAALTFQTRLETGTAELSIAPATAHALLGRWRAGLTWAFSGTVGGTTSQALGPSVAVAVPGGVLGVHLLRGFSGRSDELWLTASVRP